MAKYVTQYRVFIATPSDITEEREIISQIINEWNIQVGQHKNVNIEVTGWDTHSYPEAGDRPQGLINKQVLDSADIVIGAFWTKFGTSTGVAGSGTEEEIRRSIAQNKKVMVYFSDKPVSPSQLIAEEYSKIKTFKDEFRGRGLYFSYDDTNKFRELIRNHVAQVMNNLTSQESDNDGTPEISISFPTKYWTIILANIEQTRIVQIPEFEKLRKSGKDASEIPEEIATALAGPYIIRAKLIDELYKAGAMTKDAVEQLGSKKLLELINLEK